MSKESDGKKGISVLIPAYNPNIEDIRRILVALINQTYADFEIIIANDGDDFYGGIEDLIPSIKIPFQYKKNNSCLGLYFSIKENLQYCAYENILVLEQDIVPLGRNYLSSMIELLESCPQCVISSRLMIDLNTDYKKYIFYKRRIFNLETIDRTQVTSKPLSNDVIETEVTFTKADLLSKNALEGLLSMGSADNNTAQDIILSSIVRRNKKIVTSNATACEIGYSDPNSLAFFLRKEYLYGKSVVDTWRYSDKRILKATGYFREKVLRVLFVLAETIAIFLCSFEFLVGGILRFPLLITIFGLGLLYSQAVLARVDFWGFFRGSRHRLNESVKSTFYVMLLDVSYALGILRGSV
jgi:glycosyltransferase involved in cell wall biosynthesis